MEGIMNGEKRRPNGEQTAQASGSTTPIGGNDNSTRWGSQINNPNDTVAVGTNTAQVGINAADDVASKREGAEVQDDTNAYVQGNADYGMTPEDAFSRYNTTGISSKNRRKLSRLVDALNARNWGTTRAAGQFDNSGVSSSNAGWVALPTKDVSTMESRAQRRVEGYEGQASQAAIARDDMLRRMAPELWRLKETLTTQFAASLDNTQVNAINQAISLWFAETHQEFTNKETIRHLLDLSAMLTTLPGEVQSTIINALAGTPQMSRIMAKMSERWNTLQQHRLQYGGLNDEEFAEEQSLGNFFNSQFYRSVQYAGGMAATIPEAFVNQFKGKGDN